MESSARRLQVDRTRYRPVRSHIIEDVESCVSAAGVPPFWQCLQRTGQLIDPWQNCPETVLGKKVRSLETGLDTEVFVSPLSRHGSCPDHAYARGVGSAMRCQCRPTGACGLAETHISLC